MNQMNILFKDYLNSKKFKFIKSTWYRETSDFIQLINFQKSSYGDLYYVNLAMDIRKDCINQVKPENKCPFRLRADFLESSDSTAEFFDFENQKISLQERKNQIIFFLNRCILFLDSIDSIEKLRKEYKEKNTEIFAQTLMTADFLKKIE